MGQCNQETLKVRERLKGGNHRDGKAAGGLSLLPPALQTEEQGHEIRNVDTCGKWKRQRLWILSSPQMGRHPADNLALVMGDLCLTDMQDCKRKNLCCSESYLW